jgi:hypothetical protein
VPVGCGDSDSLSASAASTLLGAQDAQYFRENPQARLRRSEAGAQAIYLAKGAASKTAFRGFRARWHRAYGDGRRQRSLPELLSFFAFPRHLWRKLRTTNVIEAVSWKYDEEPDDGVL